MSNKKLIILVAPTGNQVDRDGAHIPTSPDEIAEEAYRCYKAGASVVHIHARDPITKLATGDVSIFGDIIKKIKNKSEILVQTTTSLGLKFNENTKQWAWHSAEERMGLLSLKPSQDLLSCPLGSWEFIHPEGGQSIPSTQINGYEFLKKNISAIVKTGLSWEMEIAEVGFLHNAFRLAEEGIFNRYSTNFWLDYVMGYGGMPATARQLMFMAEEGNRLFPQAKWEVNATGKMQFPLNIVGAAMDCDIVRVGFEDNVYLPNGNPAKNNYELVEAMTTIAENLGRRVATVDEAREILGMAPIV